MLVSEPIHGSNDSLPIMAMINTQSLEESGLGEKYVTLKYNLDNLWYFKINVSVKPEHTQEIFSFAGMSLSTTMDVVDGIRATPPGQAGEPTTEVVSLVYASLPLFLQSSYWPPYKLLKVLFLTQPLL